MSDTRDTAAGTAAFIGLPPSPPATYADTVYDTYGATSVHTLPAHSIGDLLTVMFVRTAGGWAGCEVTGITAGWTLVGKSEVVGFWSLYVYSKIAASGSEPNPTVSWDVSYDMDAAGCAFNIPSGGFNAADPWGGSTPADDWTNSGGTAPWLPATAANTTGSTRMFCFYGGPNGGGTPTLSTANGFTLDHAFVSHPPNSVTNNFGIAYKESVNESPCGMPTWSGGNAGIYPYHHAVSAALKAP